MNTSNSLYQQVIALTVLFVAVLGLLTIYNVKYPDSITGKAFAAMGSARVVRVPIPTTGCREYEGAIFTSGPTIPRPFVGGRTVIPGETKVDYCAGEEVGGGRRILREYYCESTQDRERADIDCIEMSMTWCEGSPNGARCVPCREVYTDQECGMYS